MQHRKHLGGIVGNEAADKAAKEATGWKLKKQRRGGYTEVDTGVTARQALVRCILSKPLRSSIKAKISGKWSMMWQDHHVGSTLRNIEPKPRKGILRLHDDLSKEQSAIAVQMRTGKIGLRQFLHRRKVPDIDSPMCGCREGQQTVHHILFDCRKYRTMRRGYWDEEKREAPWGRLELRNILTTPGGLKKAVEFMKDTGLLGQLRAPLADENDRW